MRYDRHTRSTCKNIELSEGCDKVKIRGASIALVVDRKNKADARSLDDFPQVSTFLSVMTDKYKNLKVKELQGKRVYKS